MTITVIDSSAILRLCFQEGDLSQIDMVMRDSPAISVLGAIEVPCAIAARFHRGQVNGSDRDRLLQVADEVLSVMLQLALTEDVKEEAVRIGKGFLVRTLDAVHIATAVVLAKQEQSSGGAVRFCTADIRQADVAIALFGKSQVDFVPPWRSTSP